jgi:hypothetical protein
MMIRHIQVRRLPDGRRKRTGYREVMKRLEFYAPADFPLLAPKRGTVVVAVRGDGDKIQCWRLSLPEAEKALADLNAAILREQERE